jgi:hypothetical protein
VKLIASPAFTAAMASLLAAWIHPALGLGERAPLLAPALALLLVASLLARAASSGKAGSALAVGVAMLLAGLGWDAIRGHVGKLELEVGEAVNNFAESGPEGQPLGLRPLGFSVRLEEVQADAAARLLAAQGDGSHLELHVAADRAASFAGVRFARPAWLGSTGATTLRLSVTTGTTTSDIILGEREAVQVGELAIALAQYFPDFALDAKGQPFSRSNEPRNPGALLHVRRAGREFRVLVLRALPGIHKQEGLDASFALAAVEAPHSLRLEVSESPAAWLVALGLTLSLAGLFLRGARLAAPSAPSGDDALWPASACALSLGVALALVDGGRVLHWGFGAASASGRVEIPGTGLVLGLALHTALAAFLLLLLAALGESTGGPRVVGEQALVLASGLASLGTLFASSQVLAMTNGPRGALGRNLFVLALASLVGLFGSSLLLRTTRRSVAWLAAIERALPLAIGLLFFASAASAWFREGRYDTAGVRAVAAAALFGLALLESVRFNRLLWGLCLIAAWWWLVA